MEPWPNFLLLIFLPVYLQVLIVARVGLLLVFSMSGMNTLVVDLRSVHGQLLLSQGSLLTIRFCHLWPREEAAINPLTCTLYNSTVPVGNNIVTDVY